MNPLLGKNRPWAKVLCIFLVVSFVSLISSCSHTPHQARGKPDPRSGDSPAGESKAARTYPGEDPWWKKPEYEWLIATLIVIGVGIAAGAAVMISSGAGGLSVRVQK